MQFYQNSPKPSESNVKGSHESLRRDRHYCVYFVLHGITSYQVGANMGKSTRPIYWGRTVTTGRTVVGDMLEWPLWVTPTAPYTVSG